MFQHIEAVNFSPLSTSLPIAITSDVTVIYTAGRVFSFVSDNTRGVQYVLKTAQYITKFYIYTLHNYLH